VGWRSRPHSGHSGRRTFPPIPLTVSADGQWWIWPMRLSAVCHPQHEHYYPAFPYTSFTGMTVADIRDLHAYLMTLPKVSGRAPPHHPSILFRIRRFVGFWKLLFFREHQTAARFTGEPVHDRGAYLVESLSHCAECHSSRNVFGAIKSDHTVCRGRGSPGNRFRAKYHPAGLGKWSEARYRKDPEIRRYA
jgi:hypothetical protein